MSDKLNGDIALVEVDTASLAGYALSWVLAGIEGYEPQLHQPPYASPCDVFVPVGQLGLSLMNYRPHASWQQAGALILKYRISLIYAFEEYEALISMTDSQSNACPLIAAGRCIVAHVLGGAVLVPLALLSQCEGSANFA